MAELDTGVRLYDATDPAGVPADATAVAGYVDGQWPSFADLAARFPDAAHYSITVWNGDADVLDVETGDATPAMAPGWAQRQRAAGRARVIVYMNASTWPDVRRAFQDAGVPEPAYWVADYDHDPSIPDGAAGKQYESTDAYDVSSLAPSWPDVASIPRPAPTPPPPLPPTVDYPEDSMIRYPLNVTTDANGNGWGALAVPFDSVAAVFANGADPQTNNAYLPIPRVAASARDAGTRVEVEGGPPAGNVLVFVTAAK